jgi:RimJ/RimL family protein N-acetyltransferase
MMRYIGSGQPWDNARADDVFDNALAHWRDHSFGWLSILERPLRVSAGFLVVNFVGRQALDIPPDDVSIGWWIHESAWGRGYATEAATAARDAAFKGLAIERLISLLAPANVRSAHVANRIGMHFDRGTVDRDGAPLDVYLLERERWRALLVT